MDNILPSQKAEAERVKRAEIEQKKNEADRRIRGALQRCYSTADGQIALKWLYDECGYSQSKVAADPNTGEINPLATTYQAIRETVYCKLRKYLTFSQLKEVEYEPDQT